MIDLKELRELAGKALMPDPFGYGTTTADYNFRAAANPVTVLELIDELESKRADDDRNEYEEFVALRMLSESQGEKLDHLWDERTKLIEVLKASRYYIDVHGCPLFDLESAVEKCADIEAEK